MRTLDGERPVSGTPGEDTADDRAEDDGQLDAWIAVHMPSTGEDTAPAEPVCTTCNDTRKWRKFNGVYDCPDCEPVGDQPGDTGNQP